MNKKYVNMILGLTLGLILIALVDAAIRHHPNFLDMDGGNLNMSNGTIQNVNEIYFNTGEYINGSAFDDLNLYSRDDMNFNLGGEGVISGDFRPATNQANDLGSSGTMWLRLYVKDIIADNNISASNFYDDGVLLADTQATNQTITYDNATDYLTLSGDGGSVDLSELDTDTTCDGGSCSITNTGTLDGFNGADLLDDTVLNESTVDGFVSDNGYLDDTTLNESTVDGMVADNGYISSQATNQTISYNNATDYLTLSGNGGSVDLSELDTDTDTTCDGGSCSIANTGTLDGFNGVDLVAVAGDSMTGNLNMTTNNVSDIANIIFDNIGQIWDNTTCTIISGATTTLSIC
jgi:hypothetical protein